MTASAAAIGGSTVAQNATVVGVEAGNLPPYGNSTLPTGIRSRIVNNVNLLAIHMLEAGFETKQRPPWVSEPAEILRRRIADGRRLVSTRAQERYALIPIVNTPLYAPEAPPVTIGVCAAICLGVLSAKTSSRSTLTEVKFAALAP